MRGIKNILVLAAICEFVSPNIISTPETVALIRGSATELTCRANSGSSVFSWTFTAYQSSIKDVTIYSREIEIVNNKTSFRKTADTDGFLNIKTDSAQPQDAGIYTCNIRLQEGKGIRIDKRSAHLIVLGVPLKIVDSDPNCTTIDYSTNDRKFKQLSCRVGFYGNWAPVMEWRQGGFNGAIVETGVQSNSSANFVSHSLTIRVDDGDENAISYTCVTFFSAHMENVNATATNIPNYTFIWPGGETTTEARRPNSENPDTRKLHFSELMGALAAVVGVLLLLLAIISARNYKKYNRDSALMDEEHHINGEQLEDHNRVESVRHGIRNGVKPEAGECSRIRGDVNFKSGSSSSASVGGKQALNHVVYDKGSCSYFAADGTEYMEISSGQNYRPQMPIRNPSRYEQVVYASIDHTLKAPLPPRYV